MKPRFVLSVVVLCALSTPLQPLVAQRVANPEGPRVPVALTVSGGKSLGSYQAGLNWGLIQGMKHSLGPHGHDHSRAYDLLAVTGASAGNINALISAVEWCDDRPLNPPEESLFFKIWVRTGWEQLLTTAPYREQRTDTRSILHRDFFERHFDDINLALAEASPTDCDLPIGITLTKQVRGSIALGQLDIPTQRFVATVRLVTVGEGEDAELRFALADSALQADATVGKRVYPDLIDLEISAEGYELIPSRTAYKLTAASSAFPLAFEPEVLRLIDPEIPLDECPQASRVPERGCRVHANYLDGGLFDNSPLDLALHLFGHRRDSIPTPEADTLARLVYIEAGEYRDSLAIVRRARDETERQGTAAALQMVSQAIPAARKYELHSLARTLRGESEGSRDEWLRVTDRAFPIVGEHLAGFAGFLGRPFREFDFYVGVYDALHFMAVELCPEEQTRATKYSATAPRSCEAPLLRSLIEDDALELGPYAPPVMAALYAHEFGQQAGVAVPQVRWPDSDDGRTVIFKNLLQSSFQLLSGEESDCTGRGAVERLVCVGGFDQILTSLRTDTAAMRVIDDWSGREGCGRSSWPTAQVDGCLADYTFKELVRNPPLFMSRTAEQVLRQLWRVEAGLSAEDQRNQKQLVQFFELWFRSAWGKYQDAWDTDPSTIPDGESTWNWLFHLAPHQLSVAAGTRGGDVWGLRPTYHFGPDWALVAPLSLTFNRPVEDPDERWRGHAGFGVLKKTESLMLSGWQLTGDVLRATSWSSADTSNRDLWGATLTTYFFAGKLTTSLRWLPRNESELYSGDDFAVILGVSDFNGLLYWLVRGLS